MVGQNHAGKTALLEGLSLLFPSNPMVSEDDRPDILKLGYIVKLCSVDVSIERLTFNELSCWKFAERTRSSGKLPFCLAFTDGSRVSIRYCS